MSDYDEIAGLYDLVYEGDFDIDFYKQEASNVNGPVLEIGCGTGRVLLELLKNGVKADGLDVSSKMLQILRDKARVMKLCPRLYKADMRKFSIKKKYALIIIPYRSFLHLSSDKDRYSTLRCIRDHLLPNGKLIIHVYNPSDAESNTTIIPRLIDTHNFEIGGSKITTFWYMSYSKSKNEAEYLIELHKGDKKIKDFKMTLYFVKYKTMKELFRKAGFKDVHAYVDFAKKPCLQRDKGREIVWVAER